MIVGNGLVATAFAEFASNNDVVIFASGVSNSKETDPCEFDRETALLNATIDRLGNRTLVYFSTCSVTDPSLADSEYILHKLEIERMIRSSLADYVIFRVSNIVGGAANPNVIMNYLVNRISRGEEFPLWERASRNLIDIDDVVKIVGYALREGKFRNQIVNVANPKNIGMLELVELVENYIGKKAHYSKTQFGGSPAIDTSSITEIREACSIEFGDDYVANLLRKYYKTPG